MNEVDKDLTRIITKYIPVEGWGKAFVEELQAAGFEFTVDEAKYEEFKKKQDNAFS